MREMRFVGALALVAAVAAHEELVLGTEHQRAAGAILRLSYTGTVALQNV